MREKMRWYLPSNSILKSKSFHNTNYSGIPSPKFSAHELGEKNPAGI